MTDDDYAHQPPDTGGGPEPRDGPDDLTLIELVRAGSHAAFGHLYERHSAAVLRHAMVVTRQRELAEDVTEETFSQLLSVLRRGNGPTENVRSYLVTTARRIAWRSVRRERRDAAAAMGEGDAEPLADLDGAEDGSGPGRDAEPLLASALASLSPRWRQIIWATEVEGHDPMDLADPLGLSPNAVAALAYRARNGFRRAYFAAYGEVSGDPACQASSARLADWVEEGRPAVGFDDALGHLEGCVACRDMLRGVSTSVDVAQSLRSAS